MSDMHFITRDEFIASMNDYANQIKAAFGRLHKVDLALFGEDGRGGIVKDVSDIKHKLNGGLDPMIDKAVKKAIAKHPVQHQAKLRLSDTVLIALIGAASAMFVAWAQTGFKWPWG